MGSVVGEVVEIDGSIMEGGGQILRMSVGSFKVQTRILEPNGSLSSGSVPTLCSLSNAQCYLLKVGLSALLRKPIKIHGIRAGRSSPGLKAQHLTGINLVALIFFLITSNVNLGAGADRRKAGRWKFWLN